MYCASLSINKCIALTFEASQSIKTLNVLLTLQKGSASYKQYEPKFWMKNKHKWKTIASL